MNRLKTLIVVGSAILVGILYILPPLVIRGQFQVQEQPFVLNYTVHRDELFYISRAREIYDGHWPPTDLHFDNQSPTVLNSLPSLIMAGFLTVFLGDVVTSYLTAVFVFSAIIFLLLYWLGQFLFNRSLAWSLFFAYVGILTPIALRILNLDGA